MIIYIVVSPSTNLRPSLSCVTNHSCDLRKKKNSKIRNVLGPSYSLCRGSYINLGPSMYLWIILQRPWILVQFILHSIILFASFYLFFIFAYNLYFSFYWGVIAIFRCYSWLCEYELILEVLGKPCGLPGIECGSAVC